MSIATWVLRAGRHALASLLKFEVEGGDRAHHMLHRGLPQVLLAELVLQHLRLTGCAFRGRVDHADCVHVRHGDGLAVLVKIGTLDVVLGQQRPCRVVVLQACPLLQAG